MAPDPNANSVIIAENDTAIRSFAGLPLVSPSTIVILADSEKGREFSRELAVSIQDLLTSVHSQVTVKASTCGHDGASVPSCLYCGADDRQKLLVVVSDGKSGWNVIPNQQWWLSSESDRHILPLFQTGAHPEKLLPQAVRKVNAYFWRDSITECRNAVLRAGGITLDSYRVFISYRRLETQPLAEQLFDELNRQGFSVFLDVHSVPPSVQFQRRLGQELTEKGMVVLLESEQFQSPWTQDEIDVCKRYQIGILAAQMPHARDGKPVAGVAGIAARRIVLTKEDFQTKPEVIRNDVTDFLQWGTLQELGPASACSKLVQQIRDEHDRALLHRRQEMRDEMRRFLTDAKAEDFEWRADGLLSVVSGGRRYVVWLTSRPAELPDFHVTYGGSQNSLKAKGVLIGPRDLLEPETHLRQDWLSGLCGFSSHDPGEMLDVAERMAAGTL
jgi:hypothetical protein